MFVYRIQPKWLQNKKACSSIHNEDWMFFVWAVGAAIYPVEKDQQRLSKYQHPSLVLNPFLMTLDQIHLFEQNNCIPINVYGAKCGEEWNKVKDTKKKKW